MARRPIQAASGQVWPSLQQQLIDAKAIHGSALEQLIRDNQDFSILRPEEADDRLDLPPWLRVYWRKQHPDGKYFGPSGGYPLVLERLLDWMVAHQDLPGYGLAGDRPDQPRGGRDAH
jgi:hypothetical protein